MKKEIRQAWSRSVNNKEYKPYKDKKYGNKIPGKIAGYHYIAYNIIRGLPAERGFEPLGTGFKNAKYWYNWFSKNKLEKLSFAFEITPEEMQELLQ